MVEINSMQTKILVFKTDLNISQKPLVKKILDSFKEVTKIDFNFENCDNILRIVSLKNLTIDIELLMKSQNIFFKALK